uniref:DUF4218 domain-containing protein n=1 Tax=Photinus pyralis TaxID=7054 RepID=A0A1Y1KSZ7_PHOPY
MNKRLRRMRESVSKRTCLSILQIESEENGLLQDDYTNSTNDSSITVSDVLVDLTDSDSSIPQVEFENQSDNSEHFTNINFPPHDHHLPSPDSPDTTKHQEGTIKYDLQKWALECNVPHVTLSKLLVLLKKRGLDVPLDARTLLKTPRSSQISVVEPGYYYHVGILANVSILFKQYDIILNEGFEIRIAINVDGLPLSKSSSSSFWPILGKIDNIPILKNIVFVIGLYHGYAKPNDSNQFLDQFVNECVEFGANGLVICKKRFKCVISMIICDLPAKAFILKIKNHNGYSSCTKCTQEGEYVNNVLCFGLANARSNVHKRTDSDFRNQIDTEHHIDSTILTKLPNFNMINNIPLDYMHLVCLGVTKRLLSSKKFGLVYGKPPHKLRFRSIELISQKISLLKQYIPCEFARKLRPLQECNRYKAVEFRFFILYAAPVILKDIVDKQYYNNILCLHVAVRLLTSKVHYCKQENLSYAHELIKHFVKSCYDLYGPDFNAHNVHCLSHLVDDVELFGSLDEFSAFCFENYMQTLKKMVRKTHKPLEQVIRRLEEHNNVLFPSKSKSPKLPYCTNEHLDGPLLLHSHKQYKVVHFRDFTLKINNTSDCFVLMNNYEIIKIVNVCINEGQIELLGKKFINVSDLYKKPCKSTQFQIYFCSDLSDNIKVYHIDGIVHKMILLPCDHGFAAFPLLHSC